MATTLNKPLLSAKTVFKHRALALGQKIVGTRWLLYPLFTLLYLPPTLYLSRTKLIWDDEFFTLYLSRTATWRGLLESLATGADQHPPSFYWITHWVLRTMGASHFTLRLPAIFGFWLLCICLFELLKTLTSRFWALVAMLFPLSTKLYSYSIEARGYGLVIGFTGLAVLCWFRATEQSRRWLYLPLLGLSLAAAVGSHYYAGLVVVCLAIGELIRTRAHRRIDIPVWAAFSCALLPILVFLPIIRKASGYSKHFWAAPHWVDTLIFYQQFASSVIPLAAIFAVTACLELALDEVPDASPGVRKHPILTNWALAAVLSLCALPFCVMLAAKFVTNGYSDRYAIATLTGVAILLTCVLFRLFPRPRAALIAVVVCLAGFAHQFLVLRADCMSSRRGLRVAVDVLKHFPTQPVAVMSVTDFHQVSFYAPREVARSLVYLADADDSIRYLGHDTIDRGLLDLSPWFPLNVRPLPFYRNQHSQFFVYGKVDTWSWLTFELPQWSDTQLLGRREEALLLSSTHVQHAPDPNFEQETIQQAHMLYRTLPTTGISLCARYLTPGDCIDVFAPIPAKPLP